MAVVVSDHLQVRALHPALGAEVRGVDMHRPLSAKALQAVHDAWMQHLVLVFPGQHITDEEHVAFTRSFGEPEIFHQDIIKSRRVKEIFRVSNVDDDGNLMPPDHPTVKQVALAQFWHTDSSYREYPASVRCCTASKRARPVAKPSSPTCTQSTRRCRKR